MIDLPKKIKEMCKTKEELESLERYFDKPITKEQARLHQKYAILNKAIKLHQMGKLPRSYLKLHNGRWVVDEEKVLKHF